VYGLPQPVPQEAKVFWFFFSKKNCFFLSPMIQDLLIIGGGINGAGIARDAAGRGVSVTLVEQDDLAAHTSSASTKLIHGGLRYLEQYEFRLVREALQERERLLGIAPHIIWPLRFVLPLGHGMRPAWLLRAGLFLYDHIGGRRRLPGTQTLRLDGTGPDTALGAGLKPGITKAFAYSDCWVEDSRLVVLNAMDAAAHGATILTRTKLVQARRAGPLWHATLRAEATGAETTLQARVIVNAAGPWVADIIGGTLGVNTTRRTRLVKGSHIVVPRLYEGEHAYILQNPDRRIVFAIPYEHHFTLIGTTDLPYAADPSAVAISAEETAYLCDSVARWFQRAPMPADVVWSYAGVRALFDDGAATAREVTRDYVLDLDAPAGSAKLLSVFGGKITTYRRLAEHALEKLGIAGPSWTATKPLPGGDIADGDFDRWCAAFQLRHPHLPPAQARRLARAYGTRADRIAAAPPGRDFGAGLTQAEIDYLIAEEFAQSPEDILYRRSKLGLHMGTDDIARLRVCFDGWDAEIS
jgi:glycerol-3-phosphate dehydrogenase